ncbi:hypothetical protein [Paraburkholderia caffeinilytica]|uniref:hypothetical protein n=1 Tax=Paraburkholderia caffeinilytica TaxID=1761016 RepID=UPI003DA03671
MMHINWHIFWFRGCGQRSILGGKKKRCPAGSEVLWVLVIGVDMCSAPHANTAGRSRRRTTHARLLEYRVGTLRGMGKFWYSDGPMDSSIIDGIEQPPIH